MTHTLPLPALVGREPAVQALLLLAIEPRLGGVVFAAVAGTGKSTLTRGYGALLPAVPHVFLPLGTDDDGLLGGLDLEATLRSGRRVARPGLLERADGGALVVEQINLLPDATVNTLLGALDTGAVLVERDGLSHRARARFVLLASYDPAEGQPRRHLLERLGLLLVLPAAATAPQRAAVVRRNNADAPTTQDWFADQEVLAALVETARDLLPAVTISDAQIAELAQLATACGVEGQRADLFAVRCACAAAALGLRDAVEPADLELAARLTILPRATRALQPPEPAPPPEPPPPTEAPPENAPTPEQTVTPDDSISPPEEQVLEALFAELPAELAQLPFRALRRGRAGSRGTTSSNRGRHIRSAPGDVRRQRIDIPATLRAAAPWQRIRSSAETQNLASGATTTAHRTQSALPAADLTPQPPLPHREGEQHTHDGISLHASPPPPVGGGGGAGGTGVRGLRLRASDLRVKQYRSKAGALFCFAVDASGSMALHRMRQAKGAVHALLQQAYVHRDRVALLAFRGERAELLLPPSQSVELARRALDLLPTGGGTPLAAALLAAIEVARQAQSRGIHQTVLVLLTDGRANVGLRGDRAAIAEELRALGAAVQSAGIRAVVVDTQRSYLGRGEAQKLADHLGGTYIYLPNAAGEQIAAAAQGAVERG